MRTKGTKPRYVFVYVVIVLVILSIALAGRVHQDDVEVVNGIPLIRSTQYQTLNYTVGYDENYSGWTTEKGTEQGSLFSGVLPASSAPTSVTFYKTIDVNLTRFPLLSLQLQVEKGVQYGVRFYSGTKALWNAQDLLDNRFGTGGVETIQLNMLLYNDIRNVTDSITQVEVYAEQVPSSTPTTFGISLVSMRFLGVALTESQPDQSRAVKLDYSLPPTSLQLIRVNLVMTVQAQEGTNYTLYMANDSAVLPNGNYKYSASISNYDYTLYPTSGQIAALNYVNASSFLSVLPTNGSAIVILASGGEITSVKVSSLDFFYLKTGVATFASVDNDLYLYLMLFLFLLPLPVAALLYGRLEGRIWRRPSNRSIGFYAALIGIVSRLALAGMAVQPFDTIVYALSARAWFHTGSTIGIIGPTLPYTFFGYWIGYAPFALLQSLGIVDFNIVIQQVGVVEDIFLKVFPMMGDVAIFYLLYAKFAKNDRGRLLACAFFLNPLDIYISAVWGQYMSVVMAFVLAGLYMVREGGGLSTFKSSLMFALATSLLPIALIPYGLDILGNAKALLRSPSRLVPFLVPFLVLAYPPEFSAIRLSLEGALGIGTVPSFANGGLYSLSGHYPVIESLHPLLLVSAVVIGVFLWRRSFTYLDIVLYTAIETMVFLLFGGIEPQFWLMPLPLFVLYAIEKPSLGLGAFSVVFGTVTAYITISFTQHSGYLLVGIPGQVLFPTVETISGSLTLYLVTSTAIALLGVGYLLSKDKGRPVMTSVNLSLIILGVMVITHLATRLLGFTIP